MIGVLSGVNEVGAVAEFFQLFKTPWEFWAPHHHYDVVIATRENIPDDLKTCVLIVYNSQSVGGDDECGISVVSRHKGGWVDWQGVECPIYGYLAALQAIGQPLITGSRTPAVFGARSESPDRHTVRIGIDLFSEISFLLRQGQPAENALIPTLELHISMLRTFILNLGIPCIEVPPVPAGYDFVGCLTHDVDFVGIRDHKFDHTMWGFLYRCFAGSLLRALGGTLAWSKCVCNWKAGLTLPLVYLGLRDDFWLEFKQYMELERGLGSTFYFIPFKNRAGSLGPDPAPKRRAAKYDLAEMSEVLLELSENGCEIGVHGLDAWHSLERAREESRRVCDVLGRTVSGIRMHWLYWIENSASTLEDAGFAYDSTFGYNDAVGFRAGTTQPFCPLDAQHLLELPLNIQDSAMFYSQRMKLSESEAVDVCRGLMRSMLLFGGALTVNWHTRSLSPERLWRDVYERLLIEIQRHRVWFGTAREVIGWFQKRRTLRFESVRFDDKGVHVVLNGLHADDEPGLTVRVYHPRLVSDDAEARNRTPIYTDVRWRGEEVLEIEYSNV